MKVMKFGGTIVGKPERMHHVAELITRDDEPKIIVLSALSGTTNSLSKISDGLANNERSTSKHVIDQLEKQYREFIEALLKTDDARAKAGKVIEEHFEFL